VQLRAGDCTALVRAWIGTFASWKNSIAAAVIAVYIVLGLLYESFIHPITILSTYRLPAWALCWP
jgi:multidrug efflux pump subunit AcrB